MGYLINRILPQKETCSLLSRGEIKVVQAPGPDIWGNEETARRRYFLKGTHVEIILGFKDHR